MALVLHFKAKFFHPTVCLARVTDAIYMSFSF